MEKLPTTFPGKDQKKIIEDAKTTIEKTKALIEDTKVAIEQNDTLKDSSLERIRQSKKIIRENQ